MLSIEGAIKHTEPEIKDGPRVALAVFTPARKYLFYP
jgi:hypothetical protein